MDNARVVEKEIDFTTDGGVIRVQAAAGQEISGETTVAPGTELDLRIRSTGASPFLLNPTTVVTQNGTFSTQVDFSDRAENTSFEVSARTFDDDPVPGRIGQAATASVSISDQETDGSSVTVDSATLSEGGFVAIHEGSAEGEVIGASEYLESGESTDLEIQLDSELSEDTTLVAMPHQDTNDNQEYEFGDVEGEDGPYVNDDGSAVTDSANVTVADDGGETPEDETPTDTEGQPGFTAVLAVLALLGAALLAARRRE